MTFLRKFMRRRLLAILVLGLVAAVALGQDRDMTRASPAVLDGRKVALVVGNGAYQHVERLAQAPKDADLVAVSVRALGFEVVEDDDVTRDGLRRDIVSAKARMKGAAVGFFYYSGHGMQIDGENYLVPVDAALATQDDVPLEAVDVNEVLRAMETSGSQLNVAVLDACRNNPWASSWFSDGRAVAANRGLADMAAPAGFLLAFATGPDHVAPDDGSYAQALVAAMATPGLEIDRVFRQVYAEVHVQHPEQVPWYQVALGPEEFCPAGCTQLPQMDVQALAAHQLALQKQSKAVVAQADADWQAVVAVSTQKTAGARAVLDAWLQNWGAGGRMVTADGDSVWVPVGHVDEAKALAASWPSESGSDSNTDGDRLMVTVGGAKMEMVRIRPGSFTMGSPTSEKNRDWDETQHSVTITHGFWLATTEQTQGFYQALTGSNPSNFSKCGADCPVEQVSWLDAAGFANALSKQQGLEPCYQIDGTTVTWPKGLSCKGYRLPTEAEWEYAARAGQPTTYSGSNKIGDLAWFGDNSSGTIHPVAKKQGNAWGLLDMTGNVWEWAWDWYADYPSGPVTDPGGPSSGSDRVSRGGSWNVDPAWARVAFRDNDLPSIRGNNLGFRLARSST